MDEVVTEKLSLYDKVSKDFTQFFNAQNLKEQLESKVNKKQFEQLCEKKATKDDLFSFKTMLANLQNQVKQVSIL